MTVPSMSATKTRKPAEPHAAAVHVPTQIVTVGPGEFALRKGKPLTRLTPKQFGEEVGLNQDTIYKSLGTESLPEEFIEYAGKRLIYILPDALPHWRAYWKKKRGLAG